MKISKKMLKRCITFVIALMLTIFVYLVTDEVRILVIFPCLVFVFGLLYCFDSFNDNIFLFGFLICFFTFLLGGQVINSISKVYGYNFSDDIERHTNVVLSISLLGLMVGYILSDRAGKSRRRVSNCVFNYDCSKYLNVRYLSKNIYYLTYAFWIITLLDVIKYVIQYGYTSYYLYYSSRIPAIIRLVGYMAPMALFIFLATMPQKKEARMPILLYVVYVLLTLGTGRRVNFMTGLLIIFAYMLIRNVVNPGEKPWITKKAVFALVLSLPVLITIMYLFEYIRSDSYVGSASDYSPLLGFFIRQGTSINVIKYTELFSDRLNPEAHYSLYNLIKWLQGSGSILNHLFSLNFDFPMGKQTALTATQGTYLADFVSYNANKSTYLTGMGYGSCYIEELYVDFGYFGVFCGNFIYGILLCSLMKNSLRNHSIWKAALGLYIVDLLFKAPRATFDAFLGDPLYVECWGTLLLVFVVVKIVRNRGVVKNSFQ